MTQLTELFVPYELALKAKDRGFDEPCFGYYNPQKELNPNSFNSKQKEITLRNGQGCTAPLYQQLVDWFDVEHNIQIDCSKDDDGYFNIKIRRWKIVTNIEDIDSYEIIYNWNISRNRNTSLIKALTEAFKLI